MERDFFEMYGNKREIIQLSLPKGTAEGILKRGLKYFVGDKAQWLPQYSHIASWLEDNHKRGLLLTGSNGVGKSLICTKILPVVFKHYMKIQSPTELVYCVRATDIERYYETDISMKYSKILIIDDAGTESISMHFGTRRDFVSELVDSCENYGRLLVMTTNLTPNEIGERYGVRTLDRLHSITHAFSIEHESLRG